MRYLRILVIICFVASVLFAFWANSRYYSNINTDYPEITNSVELLRVSVQDPPEALLQGLSARDATDGDLTDQIMVAAMSHFLEPGTVNVKYVVFDSHNHSATLTRRVQYTDYTPPVFSLDKAPVYTVGKSFDLLEHIGVQDGIDGDISDHVRVISNMVNNYSVGSYPVVLEVSNSCGETAQLTVWVSYLAKESTADIRLQQYIVYMQQGEEFDPYHWITSVSDPGGAVLDSKDVEIQGILDTDTPGTYQLTYSYAKGKLTGQSALVVIVTERQD